MYTGDGDGCPACLGRDAKGNKGHRCGLWFAGAFRYGESKQASMLLAVAHQGRYELALLKYQKECDALAPLIQKASGARTVHSYYPPKQGESKPPS